MTTKKELHRLVDELPKAEFDEAKRFLGFLRDDPLLRGLREAPIDDEPVTADDIAAIEEGKAAYRRGDYVTGAELKHERGL